MMQHAWLRRDGESGPWLANRLVEIAEIRVRQGRFGLDWPPLRFARPELLLIGQRQVVIVTSGGRRPQGVEIFRGRRPTGTRVRVLARGISASVGPAGVFSVSVRRSNDLP